MKKIKLTQDVGSAKKGTVFIQGLHGVPEGEIWKTKTADQFFWEKGTKKEDNAFLFEYWLWGKHGEDEWNYAKII